MSRSIMISVGLGFFGALILTVLTVMILSTLALSYSWPSYSVGVGPLMLMRISDKGTSVRTGPGLFTLPLIWAIVHYAIYSTLHNKAKSKRN